MQKEVDLLALFQKITMRTYQQLDWSNYLITNSTKQYKHEKLYITENSLISVKSYKKSLGIDSVIKCMRITAVINELSNTAFSPLMLCEQVSYMAQKFAKRNNVLILTRGQLNSMIHSCNTISFIPKPCDEVNMTIQTLKKELTELIQVMKLV